MSPQPPPSLDELWESIPTRRLPVTDLVARGRGVRRRRRLLGAAVVGLVAIVSGATVAGGWVRAQRHDTVATAPSGTRLAAIGRVAVEVPAGWADGAASCNQPVRDTVFFPAPQDCLSFARARVSSVALTTGAFSETGTRLAGLVPAGRVDGHQVVAGPTTCRTRPRACREVFGVPDLHAYVTVTVPRDPGSEPFRRIDAIRTSLTVLPSGQAAVPFVAPGSGLAGYRTALDAAGLHAKVRVDRCPALASCGTGVWGTQPAAGRVVPAGSTVTVVVVRPGR